MKRMRFVMLVALVAVLLPASAFAKEIKSIQVCGAARCKTETDRAVLQAIGEGPGSSDRYVGAPPASTFYSVKVTVDAGTERPAITWNAFVVPSAGVMRTEDEARHALWRKMPARELAGWAALLRAVEPFARPTLTRVTVARNPVSDPGSYLALYDIKRSGTVRPRKADWVSIRLVATRPTPWTDGRNELSYSRSANLLLRDGELLRVPGAIAARLERRASLRLGPLLPGF